MPRLTAANFDPCGHLICLDFSSDFVNLGTARYKRWSAVGVSSVPGRDGGTNPAKYLVFTQHTQESLQWQHIEQGRKGTALANGSEADEGLRSFPIHFHHRTRIQKANPGVKVRHESTADMTASEKQLSNLSKALDWSKLNSAASPSNLNEGYLESSDTLKQKSIQGMWDDRSAPANCFLGPCPKSLTLR